MHDMQHANIILTDGNASVVGFPIEVASDAQGWALLKNVFKNVGDAPEVDTEAPTGPLDFAQLEDHLAHSTTVYQYDGSLTTPPCTEGIAWNVVKEPIYVDVLTFRMAKAVMKFNSRYTQNKPGQINLLDHARNTLDGH